MVIELNGMNLTQAEIDEMNDLFGDAADDRMKVVELVGRIIASGEFTKDINKQCARLLNLCANQDSSKYPDLVSCYNSIPSKLLLIETIHLLFFATVLFHFSQQMNCHAIHTDGLRKHSDFTKPGLFLYKRQVEDNPKPLKSRNQDLKNRNGEVLECDPGFPLCLVYFMPSGSDVSAEDNEHPCKAHFCGRNYLNEEESVVFRHANNCKDARTDKRTKVRCCFRYRVRATAEAQSSKKRKAALAPPGSNWACCVENSHLPDAKRHKFTNEQVMVTVAHDGQDHVTAANAVSNAAFWEYFMMLQEE